MYNIKKYLSYIYIYIYIGNLFKNKKIQGSPARSSRERTQTMNKAGNEKQLHKFNKTETIRTKSSEDVCRIISWSSNVQNWPGNVTTENLKALSDDVSESPKDFVDVIKSLYSIDTIWFQT